MRVSWTEQKIPNTLELDWYPDTDWSEMDKKYFGEVIGTNKSFFGYTYLVVACDDGKIREINISDVKIL